MVDAIPVPDSRQKVDELFLFWLSEPSTQEILRNELTKVCRYGKDVAGDGGDSSIIGNLVQQPTLTNIPRSGSPNYRTPSPPLHLSNSPKSPRTKRRAKSPRRNLNYGLGGSSSSSLHAEKSGSTAAGTPLFDEVDYFPSALAAAPSPPDRQLDKKKENVHPAGTEPESTSRDKIECRLTAPCAAREREGKVEEKLSATAKSAEPEVIPPFFFPNGQLGGKESADVQLKAAAKVFEEQATGEVGLGDFHLVVKVICSVYK